MGISSALGSSALLPAGLGFRNLLINGDFRINQRGFTSSTTTLGFGFDRWPFEYSGGTVTYSAQSFTPGNAISGYEPKNFARIVTASQTASGNYAALIQRIESVRTCAGQTATVSFWAKANTGTPKITVEVRQNFGSGGSPSVDINTYAGQATLSTSWARYTFTFVVPSISGKTLGTTHDGYLALNLWVSAGADFNARTNSLGLQNNTFDIWGVQLEQNYQPTPFEQRPYGVELQLCQRYFQRFGTNATDSGSQMYFFSGWVQGSGVLEGGFTFAPMRIGPAITTSSASTFYVNAGSGFGVPQAIAISQRGQTSTRITVLLASGSYTNGHSGVMLAGSSQTAFFLLDAEL